jgi:Cu(I)/Ag(I) efflux system membrane fusion protein/cobalt-zinc-cadmium efflux system membrane fusion protein
MLDSESKLREAIQKMLNPTRSETPEAATDDDPDDLFGDEEPADKENLEDLFN